MANQLPAEITPGDLPANRPAQPPAWYTPLPEPEPEEETTDPRRYLAAILRYKWLLVALTILGGAAGGLASRVLKPTYQAQATIWIEPTQNARGPIQEGQLLQNTNWLDLLRSYTVLDSVAREQRLYLSPDNVADTMALRYLELQDRFAPGRYKLEVDQTGHAFTLSYQRAGVVQRGTIGDSIGPSVGFRWLPPASTLPAGKVIAFRVVAPRQAAVELSENLGAQVAAREGNFLRMTLTGTTPSRIASTLNAVAEHFVRVAAALKKDKLTEQTRILDTQLAAAYEQVRSAESALENFRVHTITLPSDAAPPVVAGLQSTQAPALQNYFNMKTESDDLRRDRLAIESAMQHADSGISPVTLEIIPTVRQNEELTGMIRDLISKQAELRALQARYTEEFQAVRDKQAQVRTLQRQTIPGMLRSLLADMRTREAFVNQRIDVASRDLREIPQRSIEEARRTREMTIANQLYTTLQARYSEARLAEVSSLPDVRILDRAVTPDRPTKNMAPLALLGGFAGGFGLALALALLLDRFDRRLRYPDQVTRDMGLTILGALPRVKSNGAGLRGDDATQVIESLRSIRLNLVNAYGSAGPLITTITSPGSGDGKSFLASNLALAFADAGHRTLLVDADIRRGTLHRVLNARRKPGLIDYLSGQATQEQVVQSTRMASVDFIGCGTRKIGGPELLASPAMSQLLIGLRSQYSVIILDSAPLGAGVDPLVLGSLTGSLMLVLRTGVTDRELASAKLDDMDRLPIRILGAVLNDVKAEGMYKYYSYLPGYSSDDEAEAEDPGARTLPTAKPLKR